MLAATLLALVAALLVAVSAVAQQTAAASVTARGAGFFAALVRRRRWLLGVACDTAGFGVQLAARAFGPLLLVQPVLATTVLFALLLAGRTRRSLRTELVWGLVLTGGLAVFVVLGRPERGAAAVPFTSWLPALLVVGALTAVGLTIGRHRADALAAVTALAYGLGAALSTTVVARIPDGSFVTAWETWAAAVVLLLGTACQQLAYRAGPLAVSLPVVAAGEPVVAAALGVIVFSERLRLDGLAGVGVPPAVVAMLVAVVVLVRPRPGTPSDGTPTSGRPSRAGSRRSGR